MSTTKDDSPTNTNVTMAVSVKLAPFWTENPRLWFAQAEAQFATRGVTVSLTKYHYVVAALPMDAAERVVELIETVPAGGDPYGVLKSALFSAFSLSEYQRAEAILSLPSLGDRKPSQLLAQIKSLLPAKHKDCMFIRHAFLSRLPEHVRTSVLRDDMSLDDVAKLADTLVTATAYSAVSEAFSPSEIHLDVVSRRDPPPRGSRWRKTPVNRERLCWYHQRWGDKATKCRNSRENPCDAVSTSASGNERAGGRN